MRPDIVSIWPQNIDTELKFTSYTMLHFRRIVYQNTERIMKRIEKARLFEAKFSIRYVNGEKKITDNFQGPIFG
jgi:hypothetical protein